MTAIVSHTVFFLEVETTELGLCLFHVASILTAGTTGARFFCSQLVAPVRDENGDICLYVLNYEDLSATSQDEASPPEAANHLMSRCESCFLFTHFMDF